MPTRGLLVVATYNEIENLPSLLKVVNDRYPELDVLIIDDNSPDGTGEWVEERITQNSNSQNSIASPPQSLPPPFLIKRNGKLGLGSATVLGLQWALDRNYPFVITMDADFSHDPVDIAQLWSAIQAPPCPDMVIGSRYVPQGGIEGWPILRRVISKVTNSFARLWLGLKSHDNTGAFRIYSARILKKIPLEDLDQGYAYLPELAWRVQNAGGEIREVPIVFRDRERGKSKTSLSVGLSVYWRIFSLRWTR